MVLLSTYNGEHYLRNQVNSILTQTGLNTLFSLRIYIRDDHSTDHTFDLIKNLHNEHSETIEIIGDGQDNLGVRSSFLTLVKQAPQDQDLYFFSDQDDIWEPQKVVTFLEHAAMHDNSYPIGYYSDLWIADANAVATGKKMSDVAQWHTENTDYEFLSFNYRVTGAAFAINAQAQTMLADISFQLLSVANMHDSFFSLAIAATGKMVLINEPLTRYRQHANNVVGASGHHKTLMEHWHGAFVFPGQKIFNNVLLAQFMTAQQLAFNHPKNQKIMQDYLDYYEAKHFWNRWQAAFKIKSHMSQPHPTLGLLKLMLVNCTKSFSLPN